MSITRAALRIGVLALLLGCDRGLLAADATTAPYPSMAPLARYLSGNDADEIALARSAAPPTVSADAEILAFGPKGYATAVKGKNHFVCMVERSWAKNFDSPDFWNPKVRAPHCFNAAAARTILPVYLKRTEWVLAGASPAQMLERTKAAVAANQIPAPESGSMAYMMSKDGYLGDDAHGHWHPHVMLYLPNAVAPTDWGANLKGSPVFADRTAPEPVTVFFVPVTRWSDGTTEDMTGH